MIQGDRLASNLLHTTSLRRSTTCFSSNRSIFGWLFSILFLESRRKLHVLRSATLVKRTAGAAMPVASEVRPELVGESRSGDP